EFPGCTTWIRSKESTTSGIVSLWGLLWMFLRSFLQSLRHWPVMPVSENGCGASMAWTNTQNRVVDGAASEVQRLARNLAKGFVSTRAIPILRTICWGSCWASSDPQDSENSDSNS